MKTVLSILIILLLTAGCKEKYNPPVTSPKTGYLIVEGFINNGAQPTTILLSRTVPLDGNATGADESDARVNIEGNNGDSYALHQSTAGVYTSDSITLNQAASYRLHIFTADGREYVSDYTPVQSSPAIDSISWQYNDDDLQMYINTNDPQNATKYYQWQYEETWEYHSAYLSNLIYHYDPVTSQVTDLDYFDPISHNSDFSIYTCWHNTKSTSILLGSTEKLTSGITHFPILQIEQGNQRLSVLYRILAKQIALSRAKYQFLQQMKKNTETLGSIFDAQPSQLSTNIHCVSNAAEQVIGFVEVSQEMDKILFIKNSDVPNWNYNGGCRLDEILNNVDTINAKASGLRPVGVATMEGNFIKTFYASDPFCVDCTLTGTNIKPSFWP